MSFAETANFDGSRPWQRLSAEERLDQRAHRGPWWGFPNVAQDLATATAPHLLYDRLDELGTKSTALGLIRAETVALPRLRDTEWDA